MLICVYAPLNRTVAKEKDTSDIYKPECTLMKMQKFSPKTPEAQSTQLFTTILQEVPYFFSSGFSFSISARTMFSTAFIPASSFCLEAAASSSPATAWSNASFV